MLREVTQAHSIKVSRNYTASSPRNKGIHGKMVRYGRSRSFMVIEIGSNRMLSVISY